MPCNYCLRDYEHDPRCPLYKDKKSSHYCSVCGDGILEGEEYIVNEDGEYRHLDCFLRYEGFVRMVRLRN